MTAGLLEACARCQRDLLLHAVFRGQFNSGLYDELLSGKVNGLIVWAPDETRWWRSYAIIGSRW